MTTKGHFLSPWKSTTLTRFNDIETIVQILPRAEVVKLEQQDIKNGSSSRAKDVTPDTKLPLVF
jgi:uncharacterized protein (DUF1499 family)